MLDRKTIENNTIRFFRKAGGTRPDLRLVEYQDRKIIVKDFTHSDFWFKNIVGPILIGRESKVMLRLKGVNGVPQFYGRIDRYSLAMEYIPGKSLDNIPKETLPNSFYHNLHKNIDEIHARGIAHCDLRSRGNVILADDGSAYIIDYAASVLLGRGFNPLIRWLFNNFVMADNNAVLRIKERLSPELMSDIEIEELKKELPLEKQARIIGHGIRNITRRILTNKK